MHLGASRELQQPERDHCTGTCVRRKIRVSNARASDHECAIKAVPELNMVGRCGFLIARKDGQSVQRDGAIRGSWNERLADPRVSSLKPQIYSLESTHLGN